MRFRLDECNSYKLESNAGEVGSRSQENTKCIHDEEMNVICDNIV